MLPIRVALSGSGFKFPALVGALVAIEDLGYNIIELAGTSGGSIIAALYASGLSGNYLKHLSLTRDWSSMLNFSLFSLIWKMGYSNGNNLLSFIEEETNSITFSDLRIDLTIVASDINNGVPFIFNKVKTPDVTIAYAARCSSSIPFMYTPIQIGDALLQDGGIVDNIAIDELKNDGTTLLGIQLTSKIQPMSPGIKTFLDIIPRDIELMMSSNENAHISIGIMEKSKISFIDTGYAKSLDNHMPIAIRQRLYNDGYNNTISALKGKSDD